MTVQGEESVANAWNITSQWTNYQGAPLQKYRKKLRNPIIGISNILQS